MIQLPIYRAVIDLDDPQQIKSEARWRDLLRPVLQELGVATSAQTSTDEAVAVLQGLLAPLDQNVLRQDLVDRIETIMAGVNSQSPSVDPLTLATIKHAYRSRYSAGAQTSIWIGDITRLGADAIVNAANSYLLV